MFLHAVWEFIKSVFAGLVANRIGDTTKKLSGPKQPEQPEVKGTQLTLNRVVIKKPDGSKIKRFWIIRKKIRHLFGKENLK